MNELTEKQKLIKRVRDEVNESVELGEYHVDDDAVQAIIEIAIKAGLVRPPEHEELQ